MKARAFILTVIWGPLMVQPAFSDFSTVTENSSCSKKSITASTCSKNKPVKVAGCKTKCSKPAPPDEQDCPKGTCNPLMSCPGGNFYLNDNSFIPIAPISIRKQKTALVNDNRISKRLAECWHPPEVWS